MEYEVVQFSEKAIHIEKYLVLHTEEKEQDKLDLFSLTIPEKIEETILALQENKDTVYQGYSTINPYYANDLSEFGENQLVYLYAEIESAENKSAFLERDMPGFSKLWMNGEILDICTERQQTTQDKVAIKKGINHILLGFYLKKKSVFPPYVYLSFLPSEICINDGNLLNRKRKYQMETLTAASNYCEEDQVLYFMAIPHNSNRNQVDVILEESNGERKEVTLEAWKKYQWPVCSDKDRIYRILLTGSCHPYSIPLYVNLPEKQVNLIIEKALEYAEHKKEDKTECYGRVVKIRDSLTFENDRYCLLMELEQISNHQKPAQNQLDKRVYYYSKLDESYQEMQIFFPKNYDSESMKYPVIFCLSILDFDSIHLEVEPKEHIFVNLNGRGILGGSYISEAAYLEGIKYVRDHYPIDMDRIYLTGKSNGGYAVWSIIQNFPDLAAGAFPISGYPNEENLNNISNLPIFNVISDMDSCYAGKENFIREKLTKNGKYREVQLSGLLHHQVTNFELYDLETIFGTLSREKFPKKVSYRTERNRYLRAYWISLFGIQKGETYAEVKANVDKKGDITIVTKHTDGIRIQLPPDTNRKKFYINLNGNLIRFCDYKKEQVDIYFKENDGLCVNFAKLPFMDVAKGNGLLDVYTDAVRIFVPNTYTDKEMAVAKHFCTPYSNGYYQGLAVHYPIERLENRTQDEDCNYIVINVNQTELKNELKIPFASYLSYDEESFFYKGKEYRGTYSIMQIIKKPVCPERTILLVNTNDEKLFRRNMFIRKITIPFVTYGLHQYWNNEALIYWQDDYYGIYEWGEPMRKL